MYVLYYLTFLIWANINTKNSFNTRHNHPGCDLAGVYYVKVPEGDVGNMYGFQLNHAGAEYTGCDTDYTSKGFNQIEYCLNLLKKDKYSRRILMTTYVPHEAGKGVLYPCHGIVIQF